MKKLLVIFLALTGVASAQVPLCEQPKMVFHNVFIDVSGPGNFFCQGMCFTAYDARGAVCGWSPRLSPSRAVRSSLMPLHIYGDNPMTGIVDGPAFGEAFSVHSNMIRNCGIMRTRAPLVFDRAKVWDNIFADFIHPGDLNGDQRVDMADYREITLALTNEAQDCQFDVNADGVVDATDMGLIGRIALYGDAKSTLGQWGYACPE